MLASTEGPLRIGILGAARITPMALLRPAREIPEVTIVAMAARDFSRAGAFARRYGIPRVHRSYEDLLADPELDAIYNPLPNSLHAEWTIRALKAGKHVLCEKPLASNEEEAKAMAESAAETGKTLFEAFHWRYHPLAQRVAEILENGEIGRIRHVEATMCVPLPLPGDIRYDFRLSGGATMDTGCYTISLVRFLANSEPHVTRAEARLAYPQIDRWMRADMQFANGVSGRITCSLLAARLLDIRAKVIGDQGTVSVWNPVAPHFFHRLRIHSKGRSRSETVRGQSTYTHQLRAFREAVYAKTPFPTDPENGIKNMRVVDQVYTAAGLERRGH